MVFTWLLQARVRLASWPWPRNAIIWAFGNTDEYASLQSQGERPYKHTSATHPGSLGRIHIETGPRAEPRTVIAATV